MTVYPVFKTDDYDSYRIYTCATKELAEGCCAAMNSSKKDECVKWWYSEEDIVDEPFWIRKEEE